MTHETTYNGEVLACPECNSTDIVFKSYVPKSRPDEVQYTAMRFICYTCGYVWEPPVPPPVHPYGEDK